MKTSTILNVLVSLTLTTSRVSSSPVDAADGSLSSLEQRDCAACAVKICPQKDFKGQCYWGCYAPDKLIELDEYWYTHTASVGVAKGCTCTTGNP
ncbi:hypothetical protein UCREL1_6857 [Eutypa lata UCREL1]|uniref:Uncharacterized protein n=1 Tax=Eutypa lata (strain UCR-EL1) TaxID=1287681 RepID=M7SIM2_EUTLA|nr:hypothetical protein UCREL1_6857 [Eutypa lata UCREL1]